MNSLLALLILQFANALQENTRQYQDGKKTKAEWYAEFLRLLALYLATSFMLGLGSNDLDAEQERIITDAVNKQKQYLDGFEQDLDSLTPEQAAARTQLYASSATETYWKGKTWGLKLPAMPGDGTSECLQWCHCQWKLTWLDRENGDVNAYWELGEAEHCPTCTERSEQWSPLKIRGGQY